MNTFMKTVGLVLLGLTISPSVWAIGTTAGTDITNTATASYDVGGTPLTSSSNTTTTTVDELLDVTVVGQDLGAQVTVAPGATEQVMTYEVTNTGNGSDTYSLTATNLVGDDFDTVTTAIYLDSNGNGIYDDATSATPDVLLDGSNDPTLIPDEAATIFVVSEIPAGVVDADTADVQLTADSNTATGAPGTVVTGAGDGGSDAVVGSSGGTDSATETYVVSNIVVDLVKSASVADPFGGTEPVPGAVITYSIVVTVTGAGTASSVIISDPIPANTTYVTSSMALDGTSLTDAADSGAVGGDDADVGATAANTITVDLGDLTAGSQTITFDVTIN